MNKFALIHTISSSARVEKDAGYEMRRQARREENQRLAVEADRQIDKRRTKKERIELPIELRQAIREIKNQANLSTTALATYMGVCNDTLLGIIGFRKTITLEQMEKIKWAIDNPPEVVLGFAPVPPEIIEQLRCLRKARGSTWNIIAHEIGVPVTIFYDTITRNNRNISAENLDRIQKYLAKHPR